MRFLFIIISSSFLFVQCKEPFEFSHKYYLVHSDSPYPKYAVTLDSLGYFITIGSGYHSAFLSNVSSDSINFCLPCIECRHPYTSNEDTMFIHSHYGVFKLSPLDSITQQIVFANELVRLQIEECKGEYSQTPNQLKFEIKVGYSLRDWVDGFQIQINDDIIDFEELKTFQNEIRAYKESSDILLYFHLEYPQVSRDNLIRELKTDNNLTLYQAYYDTTDIDFISYSLIK